MKEKSVSWSLSRQILLGRVIQGLDVTLALSHVIPHAHAWLKTSYGIRLKQTVGLSRCVKVRGHESRWISGCPYECGERPREDCA